MSMEGFSAAQLAHYAATTLDLHVRGPLMQLGIQKKPLLSKMEGAAQTFGGAKEEITLGVKFERGANGVNDGIKGYSHTDTVGFYNPGKGLRARYVWREHHIGWTMSETELKTQGILVGDEFGSIKRSRGDRGLIILADIYKEAMADFTERYADSMNVLFWGDGTADPSALHGLRAFITDIPTIGTKGGLSCATNPRWRNRSRTAAFAAHGTFSANHGGNRITSNVANGGALLQELQKELRQLRRYGAAPDTFLAGSDFIDAMEREIRANGTYQQTGFTKNQDGSMGEMKFKGLDVVYDPTLDDIGRSKYAYIWDSSHIYPMTLEGDWKRQRDPARPYNQFVFHKSLICTGQLVCKQLDGALVVEIA